MLELRSVKRTGIITPSSVVVLVGRDPGGVRVCTHVIHYPERNSKDEARAQPEHARGHSYRWRILGSFGFAQPVQPLRCATHIRFVNRDPCMCQARSPGGEARILYRPPPDSIPLYFYAPKAEAATAAACLALSKASRAVLAAARFF